MYRDAHAADQSDIALRDFQSGERFHSCFDIVNAVTVVDGRRCVDKASRGVPCRWLELVLLQTCNPEAVTVIPTSVRGEQSSKEEPLPRERSTAPVQARRIAEQQSSRFTGEHLPLSFREFFFDGS